MFTVEAIDYTEFKEKISAVIDKVNDDHAPVLIVRQKGQSAVLMSLEDFKSYEETAYLMKSPENARRLNTAVEQLEAGKGVQKELIDE